jgi:hypothetical protein
MDTIDSPRVMITKSANRFAKWAGLTGSRDAGDVRAADVNRERDQEVRQPPVFRQPRKGEQRGRSEHERPRQAQDVPPRVWRVAQAVGV